MKQKLTFLRGFPAAGKTTFAKRFIEENPDYVLFFANDYGGKRQICYRKRS